MRKPARSVSTLHKLTRYIRSVQKAAKMGRIHFRLPDFVRSGIDVLLRVGKMVRDALQCSHTAEEYIMLKEIEEAIGIYFRFVRRTKALVRFTTHQVKIG